MEEVGPQLAAFDPGNAHELARKLTRVILEEETRERLRMKARHLVEKRFAIGFTVRQIEKVLRAAVAAG